MVLKGKVAVVTGAGNGIGRALAIGMAAAGAKVIVNDYGVNVQGSTPSASAADEVVAGIRSSGGEATAVFETVATMLGGRRIIEAALDSYGRIDALVTVAGIMHLGNIYDLGEAEWDRVIETNLKGHFATVQPAVHQMRKQKCGSIMMFTSRGGIEGSPLQPNYSAAKEGILGLMRAVALSVAPEVTCNAIAPSARTRMSEQLFPGAYPGSPEQVVPLINFLASDFAKHITGQVIACAGNRISIYPQPRQIRSIYAEEQWTVESIAKTFDAALAPEPLLRYEQFSGTIHPTR